MLRFETTYYSPAPSIPLHLIIEINHGWFVRFLIFSHQLDAMKHAFILLISLSAFVSNVHGQKVNTGIRAFAAFTAQEFTLTGGQRLLSVLPENITPGNGYGFNLEANYRFSFGLELGFEGGYMQFAEVFQSQELLFISISESTVSAKAIPLQFKAEYYFLNGFIHPFAGCGAGFMFYESDIVTSQLLSGDAKIKLNDQHGFFVSPRAGIQVDINSFLAVDLSVAYNLALNASENVDAVLLEEGNGVNFVPGTSTNATNTYTIGLGVIFTILQ